MSILTKRVYEEASSADGRRILIDRLWPRGISKATARVDYWAKEVAPSTELRQWYRHDHDKWPEFKRRYFAELEAEPEAVQALRRSHGARQDDPGLRLDGADLQQRNRAQGIPRAVTQE